MIKLKELHLQNFRGWKELHLTHLDTKGLCLILGENGAGKSSIRQAIEFAMLDKTSDGLPIGELSHNGEEGEIRLVLQKNGDHIEIQRNIGGKPGKFLFINGQKYPDDMSHGALRPTQTEIERLLEIDEYSLFVSTVFSKNSPSFPSSAEAERKSILYDALSLHQYNTYHEKAKEQIEDIKYRIEENKALISVNTSAVESILESIQQFKGREKDWLKELDDEVYGLEEETKRLRAELTEVKQDRAQLITNMLPVDTPRYEKLSVEEEELEAEKYKLIGRLEHAEEQMDGASITTCPVLGHQCQFLEEEKENIESDWQPERDRLEHALDKVIGDLDRIGKELEELHARTVFNQNIDARVEDKTRHIVELVRWVKDKEDQLSALSDRRNPYSGMIDEHEDRLAEHHSVISDITQATHKLQSDLAYYEYWEQGFSKAGIPNMKVEGFLESIETKTNQILADISQQMHVDIQAQAKLKSKEYREKIQYHVLHPDKDIKDFKSYSEGQKQRVRIADIFAFNMLTSKFNFIFLDEVLEGSLDAAGKDVVMDFLRKRAKEVDTIFVISHSRQIQDQFDRVIKVRMHDGVSHLS